MQPELTYRFIDDPAPLREALGGLAGESVVGLDTETFWDRAGNCPRVSLVQVARAGGEVLVVDALAVGVEPLRELIESPEVRMVAHNARFDEAVLRREGLQPAGLIDTLQMSRMALALASHSLAAVAEHLFGLPLDKTLRTSNWRRRPLTRAQVAYAATDALVTLRVYHELSRLLAEQGRLEIALRAAEITPGPPRKPRKKRPPAPLGFTLTPEEKKVVERLKKWRLERANAQRLPAYMVCPDRTLEHLAHTRPETLEALSAVYGLGEAKISSFGEELLRALREATGPEK